MEEKEEAKAFLFYESYYRAARKMNSKDKAAFVLALCSYVFDDIEPKLIGAADIAWDLTRPTLDANLKRRKAGRKGGRPRAKVKTNGYAENETIGYEKEEPMVMQNEKPYSIYDKGQGIKDKGQGIKDNNSELSPAAPAAPVPLLSDIEKFCLAHGGTTAQAAAFYAQYDRAGWLAGGEPIDNWPGLCLSFLRNGGGKGDKGVKIGKMQTPSATDAAAIRRNAERMRRLLAESEGAQE